MKRGSIGAITLILAGLLAISFPPKVKSAEGAGQTAADFLLIGVGARAAGLGGAYSTVAEGATASFWNPANLPILEGGEVSLGHYLWYQDISVNHGAVAFSASDRFKLSASLMYLDYGAIEGRDLTGSETGDLQAYDMLAALSLGYQISDRFSVGVTGKFVNQKLDDLSATTAAADLGLTFHGDMFQLSGVVANAGPALDFEGIKEDLPTGLRFGGAILPFNNAILASVEVEKRLKGDMVVRNGVEWNYDNQYFLRTGYNFFPDDNSRKFESGLSFGGGVHFKAVAFDYAYTLQDSYSKDGLHRFSLGFKFNQ